MNTSPSIEKLSFGWPLKPLVVPRLYNVHAPTCAAVDTAGSGAGSKRSRCQAKADSRTAAGRGTAPSVRWGLAEGVEHGRAMHGATLCLLPLLVRGFRYRRVAGVSRGSGDLSDMADGHRRLLGDPCYTASMTESSLMAMRSGRSGTNAPSLDSLSPPAAKRSCVFKPVALGCFSMIECAGRAISV